MHLPGADAPPDAPPGRPAPATGPASAFDALYCTHAPGIVRQAFLLTGCRAHAHRAAAYAFTSAWQHWPEVAAAPDPVGWVRAAAYEYALSPWHRLRPSHRRDRPEPDEPVLAALLCLPPCYRRALLLHDGVGLGLTETAAEVESSAQAAASRVVNARAAMAGLLPDSYGDPALLPALLRALLDDPATAAPLRIGPAPALRHTAERRIRLRTHGVLGALAVVTAVTAFVAVSAPGGHAPPGAATPAATGSRPPGTLLPRESGPGGHAGPDRADGAGDRSDGRNGARRDPGQGAGKGQGTGKGQGAGKGQRPGRAVDGRPGDARLAPEAR